MIKEKDHVIETEVKTQWHPAFCAAFQLELKEDMKYLQCTNEYNLNSKPLQVDLLIIKKLENTVIKNNLGKIFRKHNLIEYKSPDDHVNVDTFIKVVGYACLYKANEIYVDDIKLEDITLTLVRWRYPRELFKWFRKKGFLLTEKYPGIFYAEKEDCFPTQIIVSNRLSKIEQKWLTLLENELSQEDLDRAVLQVNETNIKGDKDKAEAVLQVVIKSNQKSFEELKGGKEMSCPALLELFAPELADARRDAEEIGVAKGKVEGRMEGRMEGRIENMFDLVRKKYISPEIGAQEAGLPLDDFNRKLSEYVMAYSN